jgi:hypothetical protein
MIMWDDWEACFAEVLSRKEKTHIFLNEILYRLGSIGISVFSQCY